MNPLVEQFGNDKRWVTWKYSFRKGKKTKIPYALNDKMASSTDPATWSTYAEVKEYGENVGIIFTPDQDLLGIDIDHCLKDNQIVHEKKNQIHELIRKADTYTEISPSGEGLHLFLSLISPLTLTANRHESFEAYTSGRYFTVTEKPLSAATPVRRVSADEAEKLLAIIGYPWKKIEPELAPHQEGMLNYVRPNNSKADTPDRLSDSEVLEKMFASKNGTKIRSLYDGAADIKDKSAADLSLCSHLAFWTQKDHEQIERIWMASPLGSRKKTQERQDYRDRTIGRAIESCKETYKPSNYLKEAGSPDLDLLFVFNDKKDIVYVQNTENMCRILRNHPDFAGRFRYDKFKNTLEIKDKEWRTFEDNDAVNIQTAIQIIFPVFSRVGKDMIYDAMIKVAKENAMDSASDFIRSLKWDGIARLDTWLSKTYGTPDDIYHQAVGSNWLKGMIKRIVVPGCKFDYVLVLEGPQGSKKSTSLYILGGDWHVETTMSTDSKDFFMQFSGKAIIEFSEGETLSRTEVKRMKAIITMQSDKYRPPYERTSQDFKRRCVFAMTTNQEQYLKDETGNRRWLPIKVELPEADVEWLQENRDQLFAEAYHRVITLKETIYEFPKKETLAAQDARKITDANTDLIMDWYHNVLKSDDRERGITVHQVFREAIHGGYASSKPLDKFTEMNIAEVLRSSLLLIRKRVSVGGVQLWRWFDKDASVLIEPLPVVAVEEEY